MQRRATPELEDHRPADPAQAVTVDIISITVHTLQLGLSTEERAWLRAWPREEWAAQLTEAANTTDSPVEAALTGLTHDGAWRAAVVGQAQVSVAPVGGDGVFIRLGQAPADARAREFAIPAAVVEILAGTDQRRLDAALRAEARVPPGRRCCRCCSCPGRCW